MRETYAHVVSDYGDQVLINLRDMFNIFIVPPENIIILWKIKCK